MKIIGAGFGRTGTMSLKAALERLGFGPCYHMTELFKYPSHGIFWERAARGESVEWREIFRNYESAVDWPACSFYGELMDEYPEAKIILTVRDPVRWHESTMKTIYNASNPESGSPFFEIAGLVAPRMKRTGRMVNDLIWRGTFDGRFEDREHAISVFERHTEEVKANVPPRAASRLRREGGMGAVVRVPRHPRSRRAVPEAQRCEDFSAHDPRRKNIRGRRSGFARRHRRVHASPDVSPGIASGRIATTTTLP